MIDTDTTGKKLSVLLGGKLIGMVRQMGSEGMTISTSIPLKRGEKVLLGLSMPGSLRAVNVNVLVVDSSPDGVDVGFMDNDKQTMGSIMEMLKQAEAAPAEKPAGPAHKKKVLIVEDTLQIQNVYKGRLMLDGYEVATAMSAPEALAYLRDMGKPDLMLLDLIMPGMDGFKLLQIIRDTQGMADLPVIILSAKGANSEIERAMGMGISGYLIKTTTSPQKLSAEIKAFFASNP